jgi:hypothetical protein
MVHYSVKKSRGRKIKKYRKSRRGKGHGKTRRYKVFKNTRRRTLGKRKGKGRGRQMMGGLLNPEDHITIYRLINYINNTYEDEISKKFKNQFYNIIYKMTALVKITNRSRGKFLREENKLQRIIIYACYVESSNRPVCYALVRVPGEGTLFPTPETSKIPIIDMDAKILFILPHKSNFRSTPIEDNYSEASFTFESFISSDGDKYKIIPQDDNAKNLHLLLKPPDEEPELVTTTPPPPEDEEPELVTTSPQKKWWLSFTNTKLTKDMLDNFDTNHDKVKNYINKKYKKNFEKNGIPEEGFNRLHAYHVKIGKKQEQRLSVLLKNTSNFVSKYEKCSLYVFLCFADIDSSYYPMDHNVEVCYALVIVDEKGNVNDEILFIFKIKSEGKNSSCPDITKFPTDCAKFVSGSSCFTFKSFISSEGDSYSLVIPWAYTEPRQQAFNEMFEEIFSP